MASSVGHGYRCVRPTAADAGPAFHGTVDLTEVRPGLVVHSTDIENLQRVTTEMTLSPRLTVVLALAGQTNVSFGDRPLPLNMDSGGTKGATADGAIVSLARPEDFVRSAQAGFRERKVCVSVSADWLTSSGLCEQGDAEPVLEFANRHLSMMQWRPSAKAAAMAEQLINPPVLTPLMRRLYVEARALEVLSEAFAAIDGRGCATAAMSRNRPQDEQLMREVGVFLDTADPDTLSLVDVARHFGTNPSSLQQKFRQAFGMTVFAYMRSQRLQRARQALERDGISVALAADIAGYTSAANFATAYRRAFGLTPKQSRARV
ncbi:helix-turn-helix transcriptional regulator [Thiosocius teredinicola]|uniref:helix-turn-helix transcriptional regulator n=1 Tax=Thiosocius teredinicola TaxID=1973002 RepID=UPI0013DE4C67